MARSHQNELRDLQIPPDAKTYVRHNVFWCTFLWKPHQAHPSMKNNGSTFCAPDGPECTMWPTDLTGCKKTSSGWRLSACFLSNPYWFYLSMKNSVNVSNPRRNGMHYMTHRSHQMQKIQVLYYVSGPMPFVWIRTGHTCAWKILHRWSAHRMHQNGLRDPTISVDAKTQVRRNVSQCAFCGIRTGPTCNTHFLQE
jgi:hypothetical protein